MTATLRSQPARRKASISSSQVSAVKALYFSGRLMVMRATPSCTSNRISRYFSIVRSSMHGETAGDADRLAGDVGGIVGKEEGNQPRIVFRRTEASHRDGTLEPFGDAGAVRAFQKAAQNGGVGRAGTDRVEDYALADKLARQRLGQGDDAALAGGIDCFARGSDPTRVGGDIDDASEAARRHAAQDDVVHVERAEKIDGNDLAPEVRRGVEKIRGAIPAGIVDEKRHRTGRGLETRNGARHRIIVGNVDDMQACTSTARFDLARDFFARRSIQIENPDRAALLREPPRDRSADAVGCAGDDDGAIP